MNIIFTEHFICLALTTFFTGKFCEKMHKRKGWGILFWGLCLLAIPGYLWLRYEGVL